MVVSPVNGTRRGWLIRGWWPGSGLNTGLAQKYAVELTSRHRTLATFMGLHHHNDHRVVLTTCVGIGLLMYDLTVWKLDCRGFSHVRFLQETKNFSVSQTARFGDSVKAAVVPNEKA